MTTITKVNVASNKTCRVTLSTGLKAKVPAELAVVGKEFDDDDFVEVESANQRDLVYKTLVRVKRVPKYYGECSLDLATYDAQKDLDLLTAIARKLYSQYSPLVWPQPTPEDYAMDCYCHLWERDRFGRYDSKKAPSYESYIYVMVKNHFLDHVRSKNKVKDSAAKSSQDIIGGTEDLQLEDTFYDPHYSVEEEVINSELVDNLRKEVAILDEEVECGDRPGLVGLTYVQMFDYLLECKTSHRETVDNHTTEYYLGKLSVKTGYAVPTLRRRFNDISEIWGGMTV